MKSGKTGVVYAVNQFFGGLGGEEAAGLAPQFFNGARGPAHLWEKLGDDMEVTGTLVFGDNYAAEHPAEAVEQMLDLIEQNLPEKAGGRFDLLVAGPAFQAGRYGMACGALCKAVQERWQIPAITGMSEGNPAVALFRGPVLIVATADNVLGMNEAVEKMMHASRRLLAGEKLVPERDGTIPHGQRVNYFADQPGARRALAMLRSKLEDEPFTSEYPMPQFDRVLPAPAVPDCAGIKLALVTSGGIVPTGNPDRIEAASATRIGEYEIAELQALTPQTHQTVHAGYDPTYANADPNRVLPLDEVRALEAEGRIGTLHHHYFATVGNATSVAQAREFGEQIASRLIADGVQAVILTSTCGTCTRCGATIVKELERAGLPAVHVCPIVPISRTVGANRIVPSIAIPHPLGDPEKSIEAEHKLRRDLVLKALAALETAIVGQQVFD